MDRDFIINQAIPFFASKKYQLQTRTDSIVVFKSSEREVNWVLFFVLCCLGILWAVIYYFFFCLEHSVTLSLTGTYEAQVTVSGNTEQARKDAQEFLNLINNPLPEGTLCPQCGTPIQPGKKFCSNCGTRFA
jgi:hypothetical protein